MRLALIVASLLLAACSSEATAPADAPPDEEQPTAGAAGAAGKAEPAGGKSGASGVAGASGTAGTSSKGGSAGMSTAGAGGMPTAGAAGSAGSPGGAGGIAGTSGAAGNAGAPPSPTCAPQQTECACGATGFGACVKAASGDGRTCDCDASAKPAPSDRVLTCEQAKAAYPSPSWQAIKETCPADRECLAMPPESAADMSNAWGDRFCRSYPNPALPLGGINEGEGKRIYQYCCKPIAD